MGTFSYYGGRYKIKSECRKCSNYKSHSSHKGFCNKRGKFVKEFKCGCKLFNFN